MHKVQHTFMKNLRTMAEKNYSGDFEFKIEYKYSIELIHRIIFHIFT